jgi:site-specific DNA recombinase
MKSKKQTKKAVAYYRTATKKQLGDNSIEDQKLQCEEWAKKNGYKIVKQYEDVGVSGRKMAERAMFVEMLAICLDQPKSIKAVIVTDADRVSRSAIEFYFTKSELEKKGIELITINQDTVSNSVEHKLFDDILKATNNFYKSVKKRERSTK